MSKLMMYKGNIVDIFNLKEEDVDIEVIKLGACRINRFLGQTEYPYPVASHLIGGWRYLRDYGYTRTEMKQWLIHEAFESYSGVDLPSPLKALLPQYKEAEDRTLLIVAKALGINPPESETVKAVDREIMVAEALVLTNNDEYWTQFAKDNGIKPLSSEYVLEETNEKVLKTILDDIWEETFRI